MEDPIGNEVEGSIAWFVKIYIAKIVYRIEEFGHQRHQLIME